MTNLPDTSASQSVYLSERPWNAERPRVLVVACSDGRLQQNADDFLCNHLGISDYDRLYMPGALSLWRKAASSFCAPINGDAKAIF